MDQILLCSNHIPLVTSISNSFIQSDMLDANGSYVKVYLYLSMCIQSGEKNLSISSLADKMENTEKDIIRALHYWEKKGLMLLLRNEQDGRITGIEITNPDNQDAHYAKTSMPASEMSDTVDNCQENQTIPDVQTDSTSTPKTDEYDSVTQNRKTVTDEITASQELPAFTVTEEQTLRLSKDENFSWTCLIVESYLERPLQTAEVQLLTYLFDSLKFSKDLILHLYEYCCSLKKTNVKYVQAVAISWAENNITTPEQAQAQTANYSAAHTAIAKALALGRPLAKIECEYVERWHNQWQMDLAVIIEACNRTMLSIQKADFKYTDGILTNWHKKNVRTLQDVQVCDEAHNRRKKEKTGQMQNPAGNKSNQGKRTQFQSFQQRDTSKEEIDELEKLLLTR